MLSLRGHRLGQESLPRRRRLPATTSLAVIAIVVGLLTLVLVGPGGRRANAVPIDDPLIGGIGFSGPTTGDLAAVYWNPAALGLLRGLNLSFAGTGSLSTTTVSRASIDPTTGYPGSGMTFGDVRATTRSHPFIWPPGPGAFAGISYDVGGDRFALAFAVYMPFVDRSSYQAPAGQDLATRYHRISADLRNLALAPALAIRFAGDFRLGLAPGVVFSTGRLVFAESTCASMVPPCIETRDDDARVDVGSDLGILSSKAAVTLGAGLYFRRRAWEFGFSFSSRPLGEIDGSAVIVGDQSQVTRPVNSGGGVVTCDNHRADGRGCVYADISYKLPYTLLGAVTWHPRPGWEVTTIARVLSFPSNDVIDIRLTGATLSDSGVPNHIVLYRGYGTVLDTRVRAAMWIAEWLRVGAGLRFETSALPDRAVSPAAVDGRKLQPTVMVNFRPVKHLWIGAGYGFTYMLPVATTSSVFDPQAASSCTTIGGDLSSPTSPCVARSMGLARPTATGSYHHTQHDFSLSMTAQF